MTLYRINVNSTRVFLRLAAIDYEYNENFQIYCTYTMYMWSCNDS